jgi:hypothetical protein
MNNQASALCRTQHVSRVHRITKDPLDLLVWRLGAPGKTPHNPAVTRERNGGLASDAARGADDKSSFVGRLEHWAPPVQGCRKDGETNYPHRGSSENWLIFWIDYT